MAQAQQKKAEEREELRKTDPDKAALLDWQERPRKGGTIAAEISASGSATLSSGKSSASSEIIGKISEVVDNPLENAVKAAEYVQDPVKLGADAGKAVFGAGEATVGPDGTPRRGPSLFDRGLNEAEEGINDVAEASAETISDIPIVGDIAKPYADAATDYVANQTQITAGGLKAVGSMVGGMSAMAADPEATAEMAWKMGENTNIPANMNPLRWAHAGYEYVTNNENLDLADVYRHHLDPVEALKQKSQQDTGMVEGMLDPYKQSWEQGRYGEMAGRAAVDIGSLFLGGEGGAASKVDMATDAARAATAAEEAGNIGRMAETGGVNPYGKTLPGSGTGSVNPYGQTMADAPAVNPYGKTLPGGPAKPPQKVMEMDALPPDYYPGMTEPPGWKAGPYGSHGPAPVDPLGQTMHGPNYDPFPNPVQVPAGKGPVNPYGSTVDMGTGPNRTGETWLDVGRGGVDPYGKTVNVPVAHDAVTLPGAGGRPGNPMGPTQLDVPDFNPYGSTQPVPANPHGPTQPGLTPISPTAPTVQMPVDPYAPTISMPAQPGVSPMAHSMEMPLPALPNSPMANTMTPQPFPNAQTMPVMPPAYTTPGVPPISGPAHPPYGPMTPPYASPTPTIPGLGPEIIEPMPPTLPSPVNPALQPAPTPAPEIPLIGPGTPYIPSQTPTIPGMGPVMHPGYDLPGMGGAGNTTLSTWDAMKSLFPF